MREVFDDNIFGVVVGEDISQNVGIRDHLKASWLEYTDRKVYQSTTGCYKDELVVLVVDASSTFGLRLTCHLFVWFWLALIRLGISSDGLCDKASMITTSM